MPANPFKTISELRDSVVSARGYDLAYARKMFHEVPELGIIKERGPFLIEQATGKVVLDIGCTGPISTGIRQAASKYYGVDKVEAPQAVCVDLDHRPDLIPVYDDVELIIASEVLEHLANPGYFLMALKEKYPATRMIITVPNAGAYCTHRTCEVVNADHVAYYSYTTLKALLTRYGYAMKCVSWYNGQPHKAEGLVVEV